MERRKLGRTGLTVSALSLGGAQFGQQYGPLSLNQADGVIHAAIDAGIDLIDTSAYYGRGESEAILGEVLSRGLRDRVAICTKAGRLDRDRFDFTPAGMRDCFEGSLRRLKTDRVDILLAHDIEHADDFERVFTDTADVLHRIKAEGKARFIGMSGLPLGLLKLAIERCRLDVVISYCHFQLQDDTLLTELLPAAEDRGVGVLNASPLAMGLLTDAGPPPWNPAPADIRTACKQAAEFCRARGADIAELAMQFCTKESRIASTITGASTVDELNRNIAAILAPADPELLTEVRAILAPVQGRTWPSGRWRG